MAPSTPASENPAVIAVCSFCVKPYREVAKLVAGPGVFICNECVSLCSEIIGASPAGTGERRPMPWETEENVETVLTLLPSIAAAGRQLERNLGAWVTRARALGATWSRIGEALGMTRQSAWERFSGEE